MTNRMLESMRVVSKHTLRTAALTGLLVLGAGTLTTVCVPAADMGRRAAQLLIERFADPDRPVHRLQLECTLHRGNTVLTSAPVTPQETLT